MTRNTQGNTLGLLGLALLLGALAEELGKIAGWAEVGTPAFLSLVLKHMVPGLMLYASGQLKPTSDKVRDLAKKLGAE